METVSTAISLNPDTLKQAEELFAELGLDLSTAVEIFLRQAVREQGIPFIIGGRVPGAAAKSALEEIRDIKEHPEKYADYASFEELLDEVMARA